MTKLTMNAANPDAKRIMCEGRIVAFVLAMANGTWKLYGRDDQCIDPVRYATPGRAFTAFKNSPAGRAALAPPADREG